MKSRFIFGQANILVMALGCAAASCEQDAVVAVHPASDSTSFVAREQAVRHDFLERHPTTLPGPLAKYTARTSERDLFAFAFSVAMQGKAEAPQKDAGIPGYWRLRLATWMRGLPHGNSFAEVYLDRGEAQRQRANDEAVDRLALQNMENIRALVASNDRVQGEAFDFASPIVKVQHLLAALKRYSQDVEYPCPYTVYLLDVDRDSADDPERRVAREFVGHLRGVTSADYARFNSYSREEPTAALRRSFEEFIERGVRLAGAPDVMGLESYLGSFGFVLERGASGWVMKDDVGTRYVERDLVRKTFGSAGLRRFENEAEGKEKDATRIAVLLLTTQFQVAAAGLLLG